MTTMKAVQIGSFGGPETLQLQDVNRPRPKDDEVLIQVRAASVNPVDYKIRAGKYPPVKEASLPKVLGRDVSGVIVSRGAAVATFLDGDEVMAMLDRGQGGYAEYVALSADLCVRKPESLDYAEAAAVPLAAITAWQGLFDHGHLQAGERVLIHAGNGGVGHLAVQFAKAKGAWVATTCSDIDLDFVHGLGADQVIDYRAHKFEELLDPVDLVLDLIGGEVRERSWGVIKWGGRMASALGQPSEEKALSTGVEPKGFVAKTDSTELAEIAALIDAGKVKVEVQDTFALRDVGRAHDKLEKEHTRGKIVLDLTK